MNEFEAHAAIQVEKAKAFDVVSSAIQDKLQMQRVLDELCHYCGVSNPQELVQEFRVLKAEVEALNSKIQQSVE